MILSSLLLILYSLKRFYQSNGKSGYTFVWRWWWWRRRRR